MSAAIGDDPPAPPGDAVDLADCRRRWDAGDRTGALRGALEGWPSALAGSDAELRWLAGALRTSGLPAEAAAAQLAVARRHTDPEEWVALIRSLLGGGDPWWARELLAEIGTVTRALRASQIEVALALEDDVGPLVDAWLAAHGDAPGREAAVHWLIAGRRVAEAEALLARVEGMPLWRARLALWRGDAPAARALLREVPAGRDADAVAAIATCLEGDLARAEPLLRAVIAAGEPSGAVTAECWSWLATVLRRGGRFQEAVRAADAANIASPDFVVAPRLERELAVERHDRGRAPRARRRWLRRRRPATWRTIADLEYADIVRCLGVDAADPVEALEDAIDRLAGNRGPYTTVVEDGRLVSVRLPPDPRQVGAIIQRALWTRGAEAARALYRACPPALREHPLCLIYQGELALWMGAYADAERIFRAILDRDQAILWAWIGLGASRMFQGDPDDAQRVWERGRRERRFEGPTLYAYRGECHRRQGNLAAARRDFHTALAQKPQRLSARVGLALVERTPALLDDALQQCAAFAPCLLDSLQGSPEERLEGVLSAMRGNRSSSPWMMSYHLWGHLWRRASWLD